MLYILNLSRTYLYFQRNLYGGHFISLLNNDCRAYHLSPCLLGNGDIRETSFVLVTNRFKGILEVKVLQLGLNEIKLLFTFHLALVSAAFTT